MKKNNEIEVALQTIERYCESSDSELLMITFSKLAEYIYVTMLS